MVEIGSMNKARGAMSCVFTPFGILIVGGIFEDHKTTPSCELYKIEENQFILVSELS